MSIADALVTLPQSSCQPRKSRPLENGHVRLSAAQRRTHNANVQSPKKSEGIPNPSQLKCGALAIPSGT
jgi:hypothetical protein